MTRRRCLGLSGGALIACVGGARAAQEPEIVQEFRKKFEVPGLSLAIAKDGQIVRREAFGYADLIEREELQVAHQFRVASLSKPITAVAVFLLAEHGRLDLDDAVFGDGGLLKMPGPERITVRHLLMHTSGGWKNDKHDPMFKEIGLDHRALIEWTLETMPPAKQPGEVFAYSNFGYCLLGRVIEQVSGKSYEDFVRESVLEPCGAQGMSVGRGDREVIYYMKRKPVTYKMNVARMDAHGGWVGTPSELVKFALRVDGFADPTDLLKKESITAMTERGGIKDGYACGWRVNKVGNYWHTGSLPGLTSLMVRTSGGYCWAACANTRTEGMSLALDRLMWKLVRG